MRRLKTLTNPAALILVLALAAAACSATSPEDATSPPREESTSPTATIVGESTSTSTTTLDTTTTTTVIDEELFLEGLDVPEIEQLTPRSGGGHRPLLEWVPVAGSASYELTFFDQEGFLYWAWTGTETSVYLGGVSAPDGTPGPAALEGMSWAVVALDQAGSVIAQSKVRSISR